MANLQTLTANAASANGSRHRHNDTLLAGRIKSSKTRQRRKRLHRFKIRTTTSLLDSSSSSFGFVFYLASLLLLQLSYLWTLPPNQNDGNSFFVNAVIHGSSSRSFTAGGGTGDNGTATTAYDCNIFAFVPFTLE